MLQDLYLCLLLRAPVAIGVAAMSTSEMLTSGLKGRGFSVLHTYEDHLWWVCSFFLFYGELHGLREHGAWVQKLEFFGTCWVLRQVADTGINLYTYICLSGEEIRENS